MTDRRYTTRRRPGHDAPRATVRGRVSAADDGQRLDAWLRAACETAFGEVSRAFVRRAIVAGVVRVDGRIVRGAGRPLRAGQAIDAAIDPSRLPPRGAQGAAAGEDAPSVLFADQWLIAIDKPAGLPTVPTADPRRDSLVRQAERWLRARGQAGRLGVHQRLDLDTSGVVLFTLAREADGGLARAFADRAIEKVYLALVRRPPSGALPPRLEGRVEAGPTERPAVTRIDVIGDLGPALLVEARPLTGRKHQIRVHLARAGAPLLGDLRYGGPAAAGGLPVPRVMLHARRLALAHPVTGQPLAIDSPVPPDFAGLLAGLTRRGAG